MKQSFLQHVMQAAEALAAKDSLGTLSDAELWRRFTAAQDESAFALIVRRHGALVWSVCRQVLSGAADAEDAFQATFLAFVRSAKKIHKPHALASWLHGVAYRVALKAQRAAQRRRKHEETTATSEARRPIADSTWDELHAAVHEEVNRLPETLRTPFVLCCLQGTPQHEAATQLGWKIGTLSGRLTKARQALLDRLVRRGLSISVAAGGTVLTEINAASVPCGVFQRTLALLPNAARVPPTIMTLAQGVTSMYYTRTRLTIAVSLVLGLLTTGLGTSYFSKAEAQAPTTPATDTTPKVVTEYKLIPQDKAYTEPEFLAFLAEMEAKGKWEYCGTQNIAEAKANTTKTHMVFKRHVAVLAGPIPGDLDKLAQAEQMKLARFKQDVAEQQAREAILRAQLDWHKWVEQAERAAKDKLALAQLSIKQAQAEIAVAEAEVEKASARLHSLKQKGQLLDKTGTLAETQAVRGDILEAEAQLKIAKARYDVTRSQAELFHANLKELEAETKSKTSSGGSGNMSVGSRGSAPVITTPPPAAKLPGTGAGQTTTATPTKEPELQVVRMKYVPASELGRVLQEVFRTGPTPRVKIVVDANTNSLILHGDADAIATAVALIARLDIDRTSKP